MPTRTITGSISSGATTDLKSGSYAIFSVSSDTGVVSNAEISAARLYISSFKSYSTTYFLQVNFASSAGPTLAQTGAMLSNSNVHSETIDLESLQASLLTYAPTSVYLVVVATSGTGNKINFREGCTITLEIDYTLPPSKCTAPSGVKVSASTSTGDNVTLSWSAGGSGTNNPLSYYQIARKESTDGSTWGSLTTYKDNAGNVTSYSVPPPSTYGNYYLYYVRAVGTAGAGYESDWAQCSSTLRNPPITNCTAPSGVKVSASTSTGDNVTLSWSAGGSGTHNTLSHYQIARQESTDGSTWGSLTFYMDNVNATAYSVPPPSTYGNYYLYYVRAVGTAGAGYESDWVQCSSTLRNPPISKCTAPSGVSLSGTTSTGSNVTLSWKAGGGGTHNAVSYYQIARKESTDGSTWGSLTTYKDNAGNVTAYSVPPPVSYGHLYRFYVRAVGAAGTSYASDWAESANTISKARPSLISYTDQDLVAGVTKIKAAHITELQTNVNRLRNGLGLASYAFTTIQAGYTSLGGWAAHVAELRTAIDEMGVSHEAWIAISVNCPTAAVMQQLRRVVAAI